MISNLKNLVYNLDKFNNSYSNTVKLKQNDIRTLEIHVYENGEALDLTGYTAVVKWVNANNTVAPLTTSNIEIKNNTIFVKMIADCTRSAGVAKWELVLSKNDSIDYSFTQEIKILSSVEQGQEESKNVSTLLEDVTKAELKATNFVNTYGDLDGLKKEIYNKADRSELDNFAKLQYGIKNKVDELNNTKADRSEIANGLTAKGSCNYANLPKNNNKVGDYWYCKDGNGTDGQGNYVWNGYTWYFGGNGDEGYSTLKKFLFDYAIERTNNMFTGDFLQDVREGYYISSGTGNIAINENYCCTTGYIDVEPNTWYALYSPFNKMNCQVAWYDSSKTFIHGAASNIFRTGSNAKYLRISFEKEYKSSAVLSKGQLSIKKEYTPLYKIKDIGYKANKLSSFNNYILGGYGETISDYYETGYTTTFTTRSTISFIKKECGLSIGDFVFGRCTINSDNDIDQCNVQIIGIDGVTYNNIFRSKMNAKKDYTLYFVSPKFETNTSNDLYLKFTFQREDGSVTTTVKVSDICYCINNFNAYYDDKTRNSLPNFDTTTFTVGTNGINHFPDLYSACEFVKRIYDVSKIPVIIYVKNGFYDLYIGDGEPYAIFKGSNKISIIGESETGVILQKTCTNKKQGRIIDGGGECEFSNMTLIQNVDSSFTGEYSDSRAYCIHVDSEFESNKKYKTKLKNLTCINYVNAPVGAGLRNNQHLIYENCKLIYRANTGLNGAFYTHGPNQTGADNCSLTVDGCTIIDETSTGRAIQCDDVTGCLSYKNIQCTFTRNVVYSKNGTIAETDFKDKHDLQSVSCLNNSELLNA